MSYQFKVGDKVQRQEVWRDTYWCTGQVPDAINIVQNVRVDSCGGGQELQLRDTDGRLWYWDASRFDLVQTFKEEGSARSTDPDTSKTAAKIKRTPLRERILYIMYGGAISLPRSEGWTGKELSEYLEVPLNSITPRFAELAGKSASYRRDAVIKDSGLRRDGQIVWVLA